MYIIHSLLWGVATTGKLGSSSSQAFMFFIFFQFVQVHLVFGYLNFIALFQCLLKCYRIMFVNIGPTGGSGWIIGVDQLGNSSTVSGRSDLGGSQAFVTSFFVTALLLSMLTHLFLSSSLSLSYFILAVPMRKCLGKHSCMRSQFPIAILNGTCFFRQCN